ncbi:MAG: PQQ-dependent sugar dehydrogenase [Phycisphaerales bacterium]|nr:MAG: PQQ-dependent sugar dehydrogenase [Phycisphaerales bacterium]
MCRVLIASLMLVPAWGPAFALVPPTETPVPVTGESPPASGYRVEVVLEGLAHPWAVAWLPDGAMLITERGGRLLLAEAEAGDREPVDVEGLPEILPVGQGGLMDLALHPRFAANGLVYFTHSTGSARANRTVVSRGRLVRDDPPRLEDVETIFRAAPDKPGGQHFGSRLLWLGDGTLLVAIGDGGNPPVAVGGRLTRENAQDLSNTLGKVVRITEDGRAAPDNPFIERDDDGRYVYTYGHRNIQGLAIDPVTGDVWSSEHGARGGDELNLLKPGRNYGWPEVTYSTEYSGRPITDERTRDGMIDPVAVWTPALAPSGLLFYAGEAFPEWQGDLFAGGLVSQQVRRIVLEGREATRQETLSFGERIRDVRQGPDGRIYLLTDQVGGRLLRLTPDGD